MSADAFLDTNVLIYATQAEDPRSTIATDLLRRRGIISVQLLNEFASAASRKLRRPWAEVRNALAAFRILCPDVRPVSADTHEAALDLAQQEGFSFYDALIIASALEAACTTLCSEDMQDGRVVANRLTIRNPFASSVRA